MALLLVGPFAAEAQDSRADAPLPHAIGQSVSPSFEGWYANPDGTRSLVFGYFNRNYEERLDIPVGPSNRRRISFLDARLGSSRSSYRLISGTNF